MHNQHLLQYCNIKEVKSFDNIKLFAPNYDWSSLQMTRN